MVRIRITNQELNYYLELLKKHEMTIYFSADVETPKSEEKLQEQMFMAGYITAMKTLYPTEIDL